MSDFLRDSLGGALKPLSLALAVAFAGQAVHAAEAERKENKETQAAKQEQERLDPVLVTAERGSDTNTVVRANRIEVQQATSVQDLFKQIPEVNVAGGLPVAQKVFVRGLGERMLTVTIDGAAQPESAYHHSGQIMVDPDLLKRVEVEAGTGAATAGPGALAGAIRLTTKSADDLLRPGERIGGLVKGAYFSNSKGKKLSGNVFGRLSEQFDLLAGVSQLDSKEYRDGNGRRVANSETDVESRFIKLGARPAQGHRLELAYSEYEDEGLRNKRTNLLPAAFNPVERQRFERESTTLNYDFNSGNPLLKLHLVAYLNDNSAWLGLGKPTREHVGTRSRGFNLGNVSRLGEHKLSYGYDYRRDIGYANIAGNSLADERATVHGFYIQDEYALNDQWLLGAGTRYDRYDYRDMLGRNYESKSFSPSASIAFSPIDSLTLRLSHARALRGVGVVEPFLKQHQANASQIEAEKARNSELGLQWQQGPWTVNAAIYRQNIRHYIGYDDFRENLGDLRVPGYSASVAYQDQQLSASLGMSYARPKLNNQALGDADVLLLGTSTGRTWVAQVDYALPAQHLKFGWTGRLAEDLKHLSVPSALKKGYDVHDVYVRWLPTGKEDFNATLTVKNVFDKFYYDQGSFGYSARWGAVAGLPEPGRDVRLTVGLRF
ncbi:TonB-dependent receptor domain-containing protein [Chitinimonas lacunae]|uniref:TonB-dependent receptor domain-containing protein n=1 Tax=Chitinimonas lacunae TaxID=1963018 RepID=A0ABV8MNG9_9NEIS